MLLVEQRGDDGIQAYRLALARCTSHEEVGGLGEVEGEHLVRDSLTKSNRKVELRLLEGARSDTIAHRDGLQVVVGHLDTDGRLSGYRSDDTDTRLRGYRHGDFIAQVLHAANLRAAFEHDLEERNRWADGRRD